MAKSSPINVMARNSFAIASDVLTEPILISPNSLQRKQFHLYNSQPVEILKIVEVSNPSSSNSHSIHNF